MTDSEAAVFWWIIIIAGVIAAIVIVTGTVMERRDRRQCIMAFIAGRAEMADHEFLDRLGCSDEHRALCLACRNTLADLGTIAPELIHPDDSIEALFSLQYDGGDPFEFQWELEKRVGIKLDDQFVHAPDVHTFADLVQHVIAHVNPPRAGAARASEPRTEVRGRRST